MKRFPEPIIPGARLIVTLAAVVCLVSTPAWAGPGYSITTTVESGQGKIKPSSPTVKSGGSKTIKMKPARGWHVAEVTIDDDSAVYHKDSALVGTAVSLKRRTVKYRLSDVTADQTVRVRFEKDRKFDLDVSVIGNGIVKVRPGPVKKCGPGPDTCSGSYKEDKTAKLKATPANGYVFAGWSGSTSGLTGKLKLVMNADKAVTATFVAASAPASPLRVAEKISVVDAKNGAAAQAAALVTAADLPPGSDYEQDETFVFVEERSVEAFDTINEILCMTGQTQYDEMLNQGPYKALVDQKQCSNEKDDASGTAGEGAQTSGVERPEYMQWTIDSSRAGHGAPQVVKAWVRETSDDPWEPSQLIFARMVITESASPANPYGIFDLDFEAYPLPDGGSSTGALAAIDEGQPLFRGYMRTERSASGDVLLKFISDSAEGVPGGGFSEKATLNKSATGGRGTTWTRDAWGEFVEEHGFNIAFDDDHFLRADSENRQCLDRNDFDETAWRYGLYEATTGDRVNPKSGFPVRVIRDGVEYHGWVGYWGIWFPEELELQNGDTVYREEFGNGPEPGEVTPYELFIAQGKLRKHTKRLLSLGDIKNIPLDRWDETAQIQYRTIWNGTDFVNVSRFDAAGNWTQISPPETVDLSILPQDTMFFWSQGLGGNVNVKLTCTEYQQGEYVSFSCGASDANSVVIYTETVVYPGDTAPDTLACLTQCPNGANDDGPELFFNMGGLEYQNVPPTSAQRIDYTFDSDAMLLMSGATPVVQTVENQYHPWGIQSGALFEPTPGNLAALACDWDQSGTSTCGWQAWDQLAEYYTWESGPFEWNRLSALKNQQDEFERFEPPLSVQYTHHQLDETAHDHKYDGTAFYLEYNGFGDLHGIPGVCVDVGTGDEVSCGPETRWIPELTIPDGSELESENDTYLSKALEKEQRMREVDASACADLHLTTYELPSIADWTPPDIGPEPAIDGPPAVVGGVIQN